MKILLRSISTDNVKFNKKMDLDFVYGNPEGTFSFLFLSCAPKLLTRFNNIITRLNDFICRSNKLFTLVKQDNNSFKRLIMSYAQVIYLVLTTYYCIETCAARY